MSVAGSDLLEVEATGGILQLALFPDLTTQGAVEDVLDAYLATAYTKLGGSLSASLADEAAKAYAYWQAYERRLEQLAGHGRGTISLVGQFSVGTTGEQIAELRRKADAWMQLWLSLAPASATTTEASASGGASRTTSNPVEW